MTCNTNALERPVDHAAIRAREAEIAREVGSFAGNLARGSVVAIMVLAVFKLMAMTIGL